MTHLLLYRGTEDISAATAEGGGAYVVRRRRWLAMTLMLVLLWL